MIEHINVGRVPKDPGPSAWKAMMSKGPRYPSLERAIRADWVIIGAGFAGLSAARRLQQQVGDESIVVLEAGCLADGPAGRNSGFMIDLPHELNSSAYAGTAEEDARHIRLHRMAIDFAEAMALDFGLPRAVFDRSGKYTAACSPRGEHHLEEYAGHLAAMGEQYRILDAEQMHALTGINFYSRGLYTPNAAMIQPAAYIEGIAKGLTPEILLFEKSPVVRIDRGPVHTVHTPSGRVETPRILLAVNGLVQQFGYFPRQLLHVFTYASMTRALTDTELERLGGKADWGLVPADPMGTTVRKISDYRGSGHRLIVRNHGTLNQSMIPSRGNLHRAARLQDRAFHNRFPMLDDVEFEYRWGGRLCLSLNSVPAFGELEPGIFAACCQNGLGTVKGTLAGMMAADLAAGVDSEALQDFQRTENPKKLPPDPFLSLGANATMRWREYQAGIEL